jgi:putative toxin-antitoxin system antitoxin component (TIGR02293 family)
MTFMPANVPKKRKAHIQDRAINRGPGLQHPSPTKPLEKKNLAFRGRRRRKTIGGAFVDVDQIRSGISVENYGDIAKKIGVSAAHLAVTLDISPRTIASRAEVGEALTPRETEKAMRAKTIMEKAEKVFGSNAEAQIWMNSSQGGLENETPLNLLDTDVGGRHVEDYLSAIECGNVW